MMIRSESEDEMDELVSDLIFERIDHAAYVINIKDAQHANFWDFPLFFNVYKYFGYWGTIDARRLLEITSTYTRAFFDKYLKGDGETLFDGLSDPYAEVTVQAKNHE